MLITKTILTELQWLDQIINFRINQVKNGADIDKSLLDFEMPPVNAGESMYADILIHFDFRQTERLIIAIAIATYINPVIFEPFVNTKDGVTKIPAVFGGTLSTTHASFLPTVQTAIFLIAGEDLELKIMVLDIFAETGLLRKFNIINIGSELPHETLNEKLLQLSDEYVDYLIQNRKHSPTFSDKFPAKLITSALNWDDLVLPSFTLEQIEHILTWVKYEKILMQDWGLQDKIKRGYRALFYGPPGTGKSLTAVLLGKALDHDVYRIDLAMTVSKWIGETEKNLKNIFERAEDRNWILFFDEADALFNKRTNVQSSNDRSSNQQVAYLLQQIEDYSGIVILSTNLKQNIDEAFVRRLQSVVHFPMPQTDERQKIWSNVLENQYYKIADDIDLTEIAEKYQVSGGNIINVLRSVCIKAIQRNSKVILKTDLIASLAEELNKYGKSI